MVKAKENPSNGLLTDFEISVTEKTGRPFNMSCSDAALTKDDRVFLIPSTFSSMLSSYINYSAVGKLKLKAF